MVLHAKYAKNEALLGDPAALLALRGFLRAGIKPEQIGLTLTMQRHLGLVAITGK